MIATSRRRVFRDPVLEAQFQRDGYVVRRSISQESVAVLTRHFHRLGQPHEHGAMYSNVHVLSEPENRVIGGDIAAALADLVAELCLDYRLDGGTLLVKGVGEASVCQLHQDWNTVDEGQCDALVLWVPLVPVDTINGCLTVAPGSHRGHNTIRGANFPSAHLEFDSDLEPFLVDLPMNVGDVCYFAQSLLHGSRPNLTGEARPALYAGATPAESTMLHYLHLSSDTYAVLEIDEDFYYRGDAGRLAEGIRPEGASQRSTIQHPIGGAIDRGDLIRFLERRPRV